MVTDQKSIFYATDRVTKGLVKKTRKSLYSKDKVFVKIYNEIDNSSSKKTNIINEKLPLNIPFIEK